MNWFKNNLRALARLGFVLGGLAVLAWAVPSTSADEDPDKKKDAKEKGDEGGEREGDEKDGTKTAAKGGSAFGAFLPIGLANEGVIIPSFDGGVRTSLIKAKTMTRVDEHHLEMDDMVIENFLPDGSVDSTITLLRARYHMESGVLMSRSRSRIERPDFEIEADGLVFDTESQRGRMVGNVEMVIFDVKAFGAQQGISEEEEPGVGESKPKVESGVGGEK